MHLFVFKKIVFPLTSLRREFRVSILERGAIQYLLKDTLAGGKLAKYWRGLNLGPWLHSALKRFFTLFLSLVSQLEL